LIGHGGVGFYHLPTTTVYHRTSLPFLPSAFALSPPREPIRRLWRQREDPALPAGPHRLNTLRTASHRPALPQHPTNNLPWLPPRIASRRCYNDFPIIGAGRGARWSELGGHHGRGRGGRRRYRRAWHLAISRPQGLLAAASPPAQPPVQHAGAGPRHQPAACATISPPRHLS
jgi:hypothetical protein